MKVDLEKVSLTVHENHDDIRTLVDAYLLLNEAARTISALKKQVVAFVGKTLDEGGHSWVELEDVTLGYTTPNVKVAVNESRWVDACHDSDVLASLKREYDKAREPFIEDVTPNSRVFIRRKRSAK